MPSEIIMGDQEKKNDSTKDYDIGVGFTTLRHEVSVREDATTCKLALQSEYFIQCSNRFELKYRLAQLFVALAKKMHLDLVKCHDKHTTLCCEAGLKTRAILFGSCTLEVVQAIRVMGSLATIALQWTHPMPEESIRHYPHVAKGIQKRSNFVRLFNNLWAQQLKNEVANLVNQIKIGKDITSFSVVQETDNQSQNLADSEMLKKMEIDADHEAQIIQRLLMKTHISTNRSTLKQCHTEIPQTQTQTQNKRNKSEAELELESECESFRQQRSKSLGQRKHSSLKKKGLSKSRSQSELPRVMFSNSHSVHELSLSRESREARMGPEGTAVYSDGKPKPLVSVKTGAFVWPNISTSTRKAIAPFNFSEDGSDLKMGPLSESETESKAESATKAETVTKADSQSSDLSNSTDSSKDVLPLKKRAFGKRKSGAELENGQENQKPGTQFPLALQVASSSLSSLFGKGNSGKSKRKSALRRSSSSKRLRRHDTSSYLSSQTVAQNVSTTPNTENNLVIQPSTLVN